MLFISSIIISFLLLIYSSKLIHSSMFWMKYFLIHLLVYLLNHNLDIIGTRIYFPHLSLASLVFFELQLIKDVVVSFIFASNHIIIFFGFLCMTFYFSELLFTWICYLLYFSCSISVIWNLRVICFSIFSISFLIVSSYCLRASVSCFMICAGCLLLLLSDTTILWQTLLLFCRVLRWIISCIFLFAWKGTSTGFVLESASIWFMKFCLLSGMIVHPHLPRFLFFLEVLIMLSGFIFTELSNNYW